MLFIIEGPDGAGKTTLANRLAKRLSSMGYRVERLHKGPPTEHPLHEYFKPLATYDPRERTAVICDRWHWGEAVYPRVLNRPTKMDGPVWLWLELFLRSRGAVVVEIDVPLAILKHHLHSRGGDDLVRVDQLQKLQAGYRGVRSRSILYKTRYTPGTDSSDQVDGIINHARLATEKAYDTKRFLTLIGAPRPELILVGDTRGVQEPYLSNRPAFCPFPTTSGHYLLTAIADLHKTEPAYAIANACDSDFFLSVMGMLRPKRLVALGRNAHEELTALRLKHGTVPHPQYVRRFHHAAVAAYGEIIKKTAQTQEDNSKWRP